MTCRMTQIEQGIEDLETVWPFAAVLHGPVDVRVQHKLGAARHEATSHFGNESALLDTNVWWSKPTIGMDLG